MKTILVLTDLSENSSKAAETAAMLSGILKANILLFNANYTVPAIPYYPGVVLVNDNLSWEDECQNKLNQLAEHVKKIVEQVNYDGHKPKVQTLLREGNLWGNVKELIENKNIEIILMGGRSGSKIDHIAFGSDTSSIVDHVTCPVLIVSSESPLTRLNKIIFATNFNTNDLYAINYLIDLGRLFHFQLEIVHVNLYGDHHIPDGPQVADLIKSQEEKNYPNVIYRDVRGKDLVQRLVHICKESEADVLAFTHQQHSYLASVLKRGTVKRSIETQRLPLLIFPPELQLKYRNEEEKSLVGIRFERQTA